jgi:hypothetical protein
MRYVENKPKTAKPAQMAKNTPGVGSERGCWFCKLNTTCKTKNSKTRPYGGNFEL